MNELMIFNEENKEVKSYAIYYSVNGKYYVIYTDMAKDENNYVILHIAKVLNEVNKTDEGFVPTGKYVGTEISDQSEWDSVKIHIGEIVSNKQNGTTTSVSYLPTENLTGIKIKSSKTFKLLESVVNSIIVDNDSADSEGDQLEIPVEPANNELPLESLPSEPVVEEAPEPITAEPVVEESIPSAIEDAPVETPIETAAPEIPAVDQGNEFDSFTAPAVAPNPFEMQPETEIPTPAVEEEVETPINPYDVIKQQREEEMVNALANDNMQDIVATPVIPVTELENKAEEVAPVVEETAPVAEEPVVEEEITPVVEEETFVPEPITEEPIAEEPTAEEPATEEVTDTKDDVISSESFVDSIVADVTDILDKQEEPSTEEKEDYERLYNDALEKTVELEKELAELHNKLNNIKNIIE